MTADSIIKDWKKGAYHPLYWFEGEENYYIDRMVHYAENHILKPDEAAFNLTVFYGKDAQWPDVVNACRRYPMFAERQVVLIKEAQHFRDIEKLEGYFQQPLASTILVVAYKDKKLDARTKFAKLVKEKGVLISTKKIYDSALPEWVNGLLSEKGLSIQPKANLLLVEHIGNDLSRIENEIEKILVNLQGRKTITEEDVEEYVGISKEYNIFELQSAIATKNLSKAINIIQYFGNNPKAAPIQLVLPSLYAFFSKVYMLFGAEGGDDTRAKLIGVNSFFFKSYLQASKTYGFNGAEKILILLHTYNLKSIGVNAARTEDASLLKEMVSRIMLS